MKLVLFTICCLVLFVAGCSQPASDDNGNGNTAAPSPESSEVQNAPVPEATPTGDSTEKASTAKTDDKKKPEFTAYAVGDVYSGVTAKLVLNDKTKEFRTRFQEAAAGEINFAGHYIMTTWGCGTDCLMGGVIDAKTGKTSMLPFTICCNLDVEDHYKGKMDFRKDSRLIFFNGLLNENEEGGKVHYYEFKDGKFNALTNR